IDQDCDGVDDCYLDMDDDNYGSAAVITDNNLNCDDASTPNTAGVNGDCDDSNPSVNPGVVESSGAGNCADTLDNDCDGLTDAADPDC
ncbi:MAG: hypothetical protein JSU86_02260, partial [Phycisphaerales bacterium]